MVDALQPILGNVHSGSDTCSAAAAMDAVLGVFPVQIKTQANGKTELVAGGDYTAMDVARRAQV